MPFHMMQEPAHAGGEGRGITQPSDSLSDEGKTNLLQLGAHWRQELMHDESPQKKTAHMEKSLVRRSHSL